jgi:hypothetical protein
MSVKNVQISFDEDLLDSSMSWPRPRIDAVGHRARALAGSGRGGQELQER